MELHRYGHRQVAAGSEKFRKKGAAPARGRRRLTLLLVIAMLTTGLPGIAVAADGAMLTEDFEDFTSGDVNQSNWSMLGDYDAEIVTNGGAPSSFGESSLRMSNEVTSGSLGDQLFSDRLEIEAGESGASHNGEPSGSRQNHFTAEWSFASVTTDHQDDLSIVVSPDRADGARMSYVRMYDDEAGLGLQFYDAQGETNPATFAPTTLVEGLDRAIPHTVRLEMTFIEGPSNDIVRVFVDDELVHTGTSWENYFRFDPESIAGGEGTRTVDSLIFYARGTSAPSTADAGFLIDNVRLESSTVLLPDVLLVDDDWAGASVGSDPDGEGPATAIGFDAFGSIQAALTAAEPETTINVASGTYASPVTVDESVDLVGEAGAAVEVEDGGTAVDITADDVTVTGLEVRGAGANAFDDYRLEPWTADLPTKTTGIRVQGAHATIENNFIHTLRTGVRLDALGTSTVVNNTFENTKGAILVWSSPALDVLAEAVSGNHEPPDSEDPVGNEWGVVALPWSGSAPVADASVAAAVVAVSDANNGMSVLDRRWRNNNRSHVELVAGSTEGDDQGLSLKNGLGNPREPFQTFADALDAVAVGGSVVVRSGDGGAAYTGPVTIDKFVSVLGVDSPQINGGIVLDAPEATVSGLAISAPTAAVGIDVRADDVTVSDNVIDGVGYEMATSISDSVTGILVQNATGVDVRDNEIRNVGKSSDGKTFTGRRARGVSLYQDVAGATVDGNLIENVGGLGSASNIGIWVRPSGAGPHSIEIGDNVISDVTANTDEWVSGSAGGQGAYGILANSATDGLTVRGNEIEDLSGFWVHGVGLEANVANAEVTNNWFRRFTATKTPTTDPASNFHDGVGLFFESNSHASSTLVQGNRFSDMKYGVAVHPDPRKQGLSTGQVINAQKNWWGQNNVGPLATVPASGSRTAAGSRVDGSNWCRTTACESPFGPIPSTPSPTPTPPVTGDTPPPAPPKVVPPPPATPPAPIAVPPGQSVEVPRGGTTGFVGGQPAPVNKVVVPPPPPPTQRTPQQVQQVQQSANQIVGGFQGTVPSGSSTPPAVTVTQTDTGADVNGLLSSSDGQNKPVPAENVVSVSAGGTTVLATGTDDEGNPAPLGDDGTVNTSQGGSLGTAVGGLTPGSPGQIVAYSDPQVLGTFTADEDGLFRGEVPVPHWLEPGDHTLVFNGQGAQGEVTLAMSITVAGSAVFSDVGLDSTHGLAISRLKALAISQGYDDGTYRPAESITRAQMAAFLARTLGLDTDTATTDLSDVAGVHAGAIAAILDAEVASGYADGTFKPTEFVTRGQMAAFLANAAGLDPIAEGELSDVTGTHAGAIYAVIESGIANGHTNGMFRPGEYVDRAQMATFIVNLVDHLAEAAEN